MSDKKHKKEVEKEEEVEDTSEDLDIEDVEEAADADDDDDDGDEDIADLNEEDEGEEDTLKDEDDDGDDGEEDDTPKKSKPEKKSEKKPEAKKEAAKPKHAPVAPLKGAKTIKKFKVKELAKTALKLREMKGLDISDLIASIKARGLVHPPIVNQNGELIDGHRRCMALEKLGVKEVECVVLDDKTEAGRHVTALLSNGARKDLEEMERAAAYRKALDEGYVKSIQELADLVGVTHIRIRQLLQLLDPNMDADVRAAVKSAKLKEAEINAVRKVKGKAAQKKMVKKLKSGKVKAKSGGKLYEPVPSSELPEGLKIRVEPDCVTYIFRVAEATQNMRGYDSKGEVKEILNKLEPSINDVIRLLRRNMRVD